MNNDIIDLFCLKCFVVNTRFGKASHSILVVRDFPLVGCIKVNMNGIVRNLLGLVTCASVFKENTRQFVGDFSSFLEFQYSLCVKIMGAILSIEHAIDVGYECLWLETNSILICQAFTSTQLVHWFIRGRWNKCLSFVKRLISVSYIF